jgi:DNA-directed RNA polymerase I subunit RPA1
LKDCNTYNADFDGDEMNCHFPQSDLARAEAEYLARTDLQYIVPTDGSPLRGLIQDHVVAGVKLTKKDTFLEKWEYQQLLFAMLASLPRLEVIRSDANIELMPPAVLRPKALWTGKQVISTLLNHLRKGNDRDFSNDTLPGISTERKAKTPGSAFGAANEEHLVLIRDGELLRGILDKAAFGATDFSLVHAVFEAYGPSKAGLLLNALGRLFTAYIQYFSGHSCRMEDLVLTKASDAVRRGLIEVRQSRRRVLRHITKRKLTACIIYLYRKHTTWALELQRRGPHRRGVRFPLNWMRVTIRALLGLSRQHQHHTKFENFFPEMKARAIQLHSTGS